MANRRKVTLKDQLVMRISTTQEKGKPRYCLGRPYPDGYQMFGRMHISADRLRVIGCQILAKWRLPEKEEDRLCRRFVSILQRRIDAREDLSALLETADVTMTAAEYESCQSVLQKRTAEELFAEVKEYSKDCPGAAIFVAFDDQGVVIEADDPNRVRLLEEARDCGGEAIGFKFLEPPADGEQVVRLSIFREYRDKPWARGIMDDIAHEMLKTRIQRGDEIRRVPEWLWVTEQAKRLQVSASAINRYIRDGLRQDGSKFEELKRIVESSTLEDARGDIWNWKPKDKGRDLG